MCKVLKVALFGVLLAVPLAASQPAQPSSESSSLALNPVATAQVKSCPLNDPECEPCFPEFTNCSRTYNSITFVNQKPNQVCVYVCSYTDTCYDVACNRPNPIITNANHRVRSEPYEFPVGGCPAANISFCSTMAVE